MSDSDESDKKKHYNCVIWPDNHETDDRKCVIHDLERKRLGFGGELASRADVFPNDINPQTLIISYFTVESMSRGFTMNPLVSQVEMNINVHYQHSQNWDKGGCYLDPQRIEHE